MWQLEHTVYWQDNRKQCVAAALQMLLSSTGLAVPSQTAIVDELDGADGVTDYDMVVFLRRRFCYAEIDVYGNHVIRRLQKLVDQPAGIILGINPRTWRNRRSAHAVFVSGMDARCALISDPLRPYRAQVPWDVLRGAVGSAVVLVNKEKR